MQVIVKARHTRVPAAMKKMATEKVEKVRRVFDRIDKIDIEFSEEHNPRVAKKHLVEVTLSAKNHVLRAVGKGIDPASAVDQAVDKLSQQVRRMKDKMVKRGRVASSAETIRKPSTTRKTGPAGTDRVESAKNESAKNARVALRVRRKGRFSVEPMTPKEAASQVDASGDEFLPFVNAETDQFSVVYRMSDGGFGLLEPAE